MKIKSLIALLFVSLVASVVLASDAKTQQEGIALIQQAIDKTNIFELPAFTLKAKVTVNSKGKDVEGTYQLFWNGPDQWREQIQFPDYGEIRVGGKGVVYTKRSLDFTPVEMFGLHSALGFSSLALPDSSFLRVLPRKDEVVKKIRERKEGGENAKCVEMDDQQQHSREVCIADSTGTLLRGDQYRDADFVSIGTKRFPLSLKRVINGEVVASVRISELAVRNHIGNKSFEPPAGASQEIGCMNPIPPIFERRIVPRYPDQDRRAGIQGAVKVYATIQTDGVPTNFKVVWGRTITLDEAAMEAMRQWRFQPAKCGEIPISSETVLEISFATSGHVWGRLGRGSFQL